MTKAMKTINYFSMMLMTVVVSFCMTACGGDSSDEGSGGDSPGGGGSGQKESIVGEWVGMWNGKTYAQVNTITEDTQITVLNFKTGGQATMTYYKYNPYLNDEPIGWSYRSEPLTYSVNGNQCTFVFSENEKDGFTFTYSITTSKSGTYLTTISDGQTDVFTKMTSELRAQIQALNAVPYQKYTSESLTGDWYMHFQSSKGEGYSILSFNSEGYGKYLEYDNSSGKLDTTDEDFTYDYLSNGKLTIYWSKGGSETIEVTSYTSTELVLKAWPDKGSNKFLPLTSEVKQQIEDFKKANKPVQKVYIYGENPAWEPPFWLEPADAGAGRFSSTEGKYLPTLSDDIYFGLKTLVFEITDAEEGSYIWGDDVGLTLRVMNGWWSTVYADDVVPNVGLWELPITEFMAKECALGGQGKDLVLMMTRGRIKINSVYYEE